MTESLGAAGELLAKDYLRQRGYRIIAADHRWSLGQVDLIARDRGTLVFVEVKTRAGTGFGSPAEGVGSWKRRKLMQLAAAYARRVRHRGPYRVDVVSITAVPGAAPRIEHLKNVIS